MEFYETVNIICDAVRALSSLVTAAIALATYRKNSK